jgi:hypothetical protein
MQQNGEDFQHLSAVILNAAITGRVFRQIVIRPGQRRP